MRTRMIWIMILCATTATRAVPMSLRGGGGGGGQKRADGEEGKSKAFTYFGSCEREMPSEGESPVRPLVPLAEGTLTTSSRLPSSGRFAEEGKKYDVGPHNVGVLNAMHLSVFQGASEATSCDDAPFFTVPVSAVSAVRPLFAGDFMPSKERSAWCFKLFTTLSDAPAKMCADSRETRYAFMEGLRRFVKTANLLEGSPSGFLPDEDVQELAKERVEQYLLGQGEEIVSDDQMPADIHEARSVVFPPAARSICAFSGNACLSTRHDVLTFASDAGTHIYVSGEPPQWASSYPRPVAARRQRWKVEPIEEDAERVRICSEEKWTSAGSCLSLPEGPISATGHNEGLRTIKVDMDCGSASAYAECQPIFEQTDDLPPAEAAAPCVEACADSENCKGWTHVAAGVNGLAQAKCCLFSSDDWSNSCESGKDGYTSGPKMSEESGEEEDPSALNTAGNATTGVLELRAKSDVEAIANLQIWDILPVDSNVANIKASAGDSSLCLTTNLIDRKDGEEKDAETSPSYSNVWLAPCAEGDESDPSQLWVFTGFGIGDDDDAQDSDASIVQDVEEGLGDSPGLRALLDAAESV